MELNPDFQEFLRSFVGFGFGGLGLTAADFGEPDVVVQLGREPQRTDILTFATGLVFDEAYEHRVLVDVGGLHVPFLSVDDLRTNKLANPPIALWERWSCIRVA